MPYLLDTNILSELRRGERCDPGVARWARATVSDRHCLSVLSLGEIRKGIEILRRKAPDQCPALEAWLEALRTNYAADILPVSDAVSERWGILVAGQTRPVVDGLLIATAQVHGLTVATRNVPDFRNAEVALVNPFEA